ncbi:hypothetical protein [Falsiruegeria mediterranea]|uniref:Uncharacterized protein n=1 Tax=Falsiruegeria mediterranea M17 TaxID=1200281 RepID=A0A2R8C8L3_9RHOB|nr:hypothetical protein [Falsiruegeria mediterranea]SPJ28774.1 hypothetical protein TRM7615_02282 [Falsiruegeria mediterranea M17]
MKSLFLSPLIASLLACPTLVTAGIEVAKCELKESASVVNNDVDVGSSFEVMVIDGTRVFVSSQDGFIEAQMASKNLFVWSDAGTQSVLTVLDDGQYIRTDHATVASLEYAKASAEQRDELDWKKLTSGDQEEIILARISHGGCN